MSTFGSISKFPWFHWQQGKHQNIKFLAFLHQKARDIQNMSKYIVCSCRSLVFFITVSTLIYVLWSIDWIVFYTVSAIFQ